MGSRFVVPHDGQAMIPLAILCAVLVAVAVTLGAFVLSQYRTLRRFVDQRATDAEIISTAYALLHDERHKGKMGNQAAWQKARDEWDALVSGGPK